MAESLAWELADKDDENPAPLRFVVKSDTQARDLFYRFDTVGRFHASNTQDADSNPRNFISFEALGKAILHAKAPEYAHDELRLPKSVVGHPGKPTRSVVLIDEIDKAPRDVPNDILVELERLEFEIHELKTVDPSAQAQSAAQSGRIGLDSAENRHRPIVIITSNSEKALPDPFLRRCVYHYLEFPPFRQDEDNQNDDIITVDDIVAARLGERYVNGGHVMVDQAIKLFSYLRDEARMERRPTLAELLDWLYFLLPRPGQGRPPESLVSMGESMVISSMQKLLLKKPADQMRAREYWQGWQDKTEQQSNQ